MAPAGESSYALQAQVCHAFVELSRKANAEIIMDGFRVSWQDLVANRADGILKFRDKDNKPVETTLFDRFFTDRHLKIETAEVFLKSDEVKAASVAAAVGAAPRGTAAPRTAPAGAPTTAPSMSASAFVLLRSQLVSHAVPSREQKRAAGTAQARARGTSARRSEEQAASGGREHDHGLIAQDNVGGLVGRSARGRQTNRKY